MFCMALCLGCLALQGFLANLRAPSSLHGLALQYTIDHMC
jgi:hypothetical protein